MSDIEFAEWMSENDAVMWHMERDPILRSTIVTVWVLDTAPDRERFDEALHRAVAELPRLRQRVVADRAGVATPKWEVDPEFDLDYHVRRGSLGGDGTLRDLLDRTAPIAGQAFDKDRPLWELHVLDGMVDGRVGMVMKLHHAISDGVGLVKMTGALLDLEREPAARAAPPPLLPPPPAGRSGDARQLRDAVRHSAEVGLRRTVQGIGAAGRGAAGYLRDPVGSTRSLVDTTGSVARSLRPVRTPLSPIMGGRSMNAHYDALTAEIDALKAAAKLADGTLNDAYVAAVLGGLARYHDRHGSPVDMLRMTMPINVREAGDRGRVAGNSFAPARFAVPLGIVDPVERMKRVGALVREQRAEPAYARVGQIATAIYSLRPAVFTRLTGSMLKAIDFVTSNVPGPPFPVYVAGARLERSLGYGPLSGSGMNATLYGYDGTAEIGVVTDRAAVPDPDVMTECLQIGLDEVLALA